MFNALAMADIPPITPREDGIRQEPPKHSDLYWFFVRIRRRTWRALCNAPRTPLGMTLMFSWATFMGWMLAPFFAHFLPFRWLIF